MGGTFTLRCLLLALALLLAAADGSAFAAAPAAGNPPMTVVIVRASDPSCEPLCQEWIVAEGEIMASTPDLFRKVLKRAAGQKLPVVIQSPGGDVMAAMAIGRMIRKAGLDVIVGSFAYDGCAPSSSSCRPGGPKGSPYRGHPRQDLSFCASACPLILAGGVHRRMSPASVLGLHQIRTTWTKVLYRETYVEEDGKRKVVSRTPVAGTRKSYTTDGIDKAMRKTLGAYYAEMGISAAALDEMAKAPFESMNWLPHIVSRSLGFANRDWTGLAPRDLSTACAGVPVPNCVLRPVVEAPPSPREVMVVARVRADGACEPTCPEWIAADGIITPETPKAFAALLAGLNGRKLPVLLDSTGGDLAAAMEIGRMIRAFGLDTAVGHTVFTGCDLHLKGCRPKPGTVLAGKAYLNGRCGKSCLFVLAGGRERYAVHAADAPPPPAKGLGEKPAAYLREMGFAGDPLAEAQSAARKNQGKLTAWHLLSLGFGTRNDSLRLFTEASACGGSTPPENCIRRAQKGAAPELAAGLEEPLLARVRASSCEPVCPEWIMLRGTITRNTPGALRRLLAGAGKARLPVVLDSPGGDFDAALAIGRMIRQKGLTTIVATTLLLGCKGDDAACAAAGGEARLPRAFVYTPGECRQECLLVLAGGAERLGVSLQPNTIYVTMQKLVTTRTPEAAAALARAYLAEMGVAPDVLMLPGRKGPPMADQQSMLEFRLSTAPDGPDGTVGERSTCQGATPPSHCIRRDKAS